MTSRTLRLSAATLGTAALALTIAAPASAQERPGHERHARYRSTHQIVVHPAYRTPAGAVFIGAPAIPATALAPSSPRPLVAATDIVGGAGTAAADVLNGAGALAGGIVGGIFGGATALFGGSPYAYNNNCAYGYSGASCPPYGYYATGYTYAPGSTSGAYAPDYAYGSYGYGYGNPGYDVGYDYGSPEYAYGYGAGSPTLGVGVGYGVRYGYGNPYRYRNQYAYSGGFRGYGWRNLAVAGVGPVRTAGLTTAGFGAAGAHVARGGFAHARFGHGFSGAHFARGFGGTHLGRMNGAHFAGGSAHFGTEERSSTDPVATTDGSSRPSVSFGQAAWNSSSFEFNGKY